MWAFPPRERVHRFYQRSLWATFQDYSVKWSRRNLQAWEFIWVLLPFLSCRLFCYVWCLHQSKTLFFSLAISISVLVRIVISGSIPCKSITTWLPASGLPLPWSVMGGTTESFLYSYLCHDQDLWKNFSSFMWKRNTLAWHLRYASAECPAPYPHVRCLTCVITATGQTRCLSHLKASPHALLLAVTLPCLYPVCLLPIHAMMFCLWEPAQDPTPQEGSLPFLDSLNTYLCLPFISKHCAPSLVIRVTLLLLHWDWVSYSSFPLLGWVGFSQTCNRCSTNVGWMRRWKARVSVCLPTELRSKVGVGITQHKPCTLVSLVVFPGVFPSPKPM